MNYNDTLDLHYCVRTFEKHFNDNTWSYYTLHLLMDVYDTHSFHDNTLHYMHQGDLRFIMPNVYRLFLIKNGQSSSFMEFEQDINDILHEINVYIPQFTTRSDTSTTHENHWIFRAAFTVVSRLVIAYRFNKGSPSEKMSNHFTLYSRRPKAFSSEYTFQQMQSVVSC